MKRYYLYTTEQKFNLDLMDKAQVLVRLANKGRVQDMKEQDVPTIQRCFPPKNGKHSITLILDEGDLNIKSSSRCEGALEKEWYELVGSEMCAAGTFLGSCFQEVYLTATINALASTSDVSIRVLKVPPAR